MPCSPLKVNRCFGGTCRLHFQGRRMSKGMNQCGSSAYHLFSCWFPDWFFLRPWRWTRRVPVKCRLALHRLHGVISHKIEVFIKLLREPQILHMCDKISCPYKTEGKIIILFDLIFRLTEADVHITSSHFGRITDNVHAVIFRALCVWQVNT
jgi:hypothetical protein